MTQADVAREYRRRFPEMPTLTLARKMYAENHLMFKNLESARSVLRNIAGKSGKDYIPKRNTEFIEAEPRPYNPYNIPESDETDYPVFEIKGGRIGLVSDIHAPFHSISAISAAIEYYIKNPIDTLVINGDFFDFYGGSRFLKDPRKRKMSEEIDIGCELLKVFQKELGCKIIFKYGNHDERFEHYLWQKVQEIPQLADMHEIQNLNLEQAIKTRLPDLNFEVVDKKRLIDFCGLTILHGHEMGGSVFSPVNIARGLFLRGGESGVCGHHHQTSEHTQPTSRGRMVTTWSLGCLCELNPEWLPINKWNHGFAYVEGEGNEYHMKNMRILKGKIL